VGIDHVPAHEQPTKAAPVDCGVETLRRMAQPKLMVGSVDDPAERDADEIADLVLRIARSGAPVSEAPGRLQRRGDAAIVERTTRQVRRRAAPIGPEGGRLDADTERDLGAARAGGSPLDPGLQRQFGDAVGADVSAVRLHSGDRSHDLNERMGAEAFTIGRDVFFRDGIPDTSTSAGLGLVAHEVAHTVQQGASPVSRRPRD
jgi:hypothetical protein